jgi:hypothetical protein
MKQEQKFYVEWKTDDYLRRGEIILGIEMPLTKRFDYVKDYVKEYWESITQAGTKVVVTKVKYLGTVLRISK